MKGLNTMFAPMLSAASVWYTYVHDGQRGSIYCLPAVFSVMLAESGLRRLKTAAAVGSRVFRDFIDRKMISPRAFKSTALPEWYTVIKSLRAPLHMCSCCCCFLRLQTSVCYLKNV